MAREPEVQCRVQAEIDQVVGADRLPRLQDRDQMPYTEAVIMEVQRCANVVPHSLHHMSARYWQGLVLGTAVRQHGTTQPPSYVRQVQTRAGLWSSGVLHSLLYIVCPPGTDKSWSLVQRHFYILKIVSDCRDQLSQVPSSDLFVSFFSDITVNGISIPANTMFSPLMREILKVITA